MDFYEFARGPLAWVAFIVCIIGMIFRLGIIFARSKKLNRMNPGKSFIGGVKSMVRGMIPFGLQYMRENPFFTLMTFIFHFCLLITPLFLLAHIVLAYESWQIIWVSLPDGLADVMTGIVITGTLFFAARRLILKEVKSVGEFSDWALLVIIAGLFLTGMMAYHQWGPYRPLLITHILLGELLLVMIPFSKLFHMILFFFTRGYLGAEYEIVMDGKGL
jgi:nitrate reductase gamma subunit